MSRNTRAIIHLENIKSNYLFANRCAPSSKNIAVIKADAYGHGIVEVAKYLQNTAYSFAVAIFDEALELRAAGITKDILVLQGVQTHEEVASSLRHDLTLTLHSKKQIELILASQVAGSLKIWLKLDTGMHRLGLVGSELGDAVKRLENCPWVDDELVISTHFSNADVLDDDCTNRQLQLFNQQIKQVSTPKTLRSSLSNSSALVGFPETHSHFNRPGIMLYGVPLFDRAHASDAELRPTMTLKAPIIGLRTIQPAESVGYNGKWTSNRESNIATVSVGYADGYPRQAANGTPVFINGKRCPLVGRVSMDLISVDVTDLALVEIGDTAELWGNNIPVKEVATLSNTIAYELLTGVSKRVPRIYS